MDAKGSGSGMKGEIELTGFALPYDYTCFAGFADGYV